MAKILVIDDDEGMRNAMTRMLQHLGHEVNAVSNGREGLASLKVTPMDLVMTDLIMPEMEGIETIQHLRKDFASIPIIAISGGGRVGPDSYLKLARGMGACASLSKPFTRDDLIEALGRALPTPV